jgi:hypothetical protein
MTHSTHLGFRAPGVVSLRRKLPCRPGGFLEVGPPVASLAVGVGTRRGVSLLPYFTASVRLTPAWAFEPGRLREPELLASPAVGVGHVP